MSHPSVTSAAAEPVRSPILPFWAEGRVVSVNRGAMRHQPKEPAPEIVLVPGLGVEGDAHAGPERLHAVKRPVRPNTRQVSLIDTASLSYFAELGFWVSPGFLGENITVEGIPLDQLKAGDRLYLGDVVLDVTENRQPCTVLPDVDHRLVREMVGRAGLLARVVRGGRLKAGEPVFAERAVMSEAARAGLSRLLVEAAQTAFGASLRGVILAGSCCNGGYVPGWSDFEIYLALAAEAMDGALTPRYDQAVKLQAALGPIDPTAYRIGRIQVHTVNESANPKEWLPPAPGTHTLLDGEIPASWCDTSPERYREAAEKLVAAIPGMRRAEIRRFMDAPDLHLPGRLQFAGEAVRQLNRAAAIVKGYDAIQAWMSRDLELLEWNRRHGMAIEATWEVLTGIGEWEVARDDLASVKGLWQSAMQALTDIEAWIAETGSDR